MDLETMLTKAKSHQYQRSEQLLADVELIEANCIQYNGLVSPLSQTANELVRTARQALSAEADRLVGLEAAIKATQDAALDAAETESNPSESGSRLSDSGRRRREAQIFATGVVELDTEENTRASALSDVMDPDVDEEVRYGSLWMVFSITCLISSISFVCTVLRIICQTLTWYSPFRWNHFTVLLYLKICRKAADTGLWAPELF